MKEGKRKRILVTAPSGFIIRNLLLGKFLSSILNDFDLVIAVQDPNDGILLNTFTSDKIKFIQYPTFEVIRKKFHQQLADPHFWMYLISVGSKNNRSIRNYVVIYDKRQNFLYRIFRRIVFSIGYFIQTIRTMHIVSRLYLRYYSNHTLTRKWKSILQDENIELLFSTVLTLTHKNTPSDDLPAVLAAGKLKIKTATLIQSWDNLSSKPNIVPETMDAYLVWSTIQKKELLRYFYSIDPHKVHIVGAVQFDFHHDSELITSRENYLESLGFVKTDKYLLIGTGMPKSIPNEIDEMVILIKAINKRFPELKILLRIHPKDNSKRIDTFREELSRCNTYVDAPISNQHMDAGGFTPPSSFYRDQINAIIHAEMVINTASTISVDAAIIGRPILCVAYNYMQEKDFPNGRSVALAHSSHYLPLVQTGGVRLGRNEAEMLDHIEHYLCNKESDEKGRQKIEQLVTDRADGNAGERIVHVLQRLLN